MKLTQQCGECLGYIYTVREVPIIELKLTHEIFEKLGISVSDFYANEAKHFNYYDRPVVTKDYVILSHVESYKAAIKNGVEKIEVFIIDDIDINDFPRFMSFGLHIKNLSEPQKYELIVYLRDYLKNNPRGQVWAQSLIGDINRKLGTILGISFETVKLWARLPKRVLENHAAGKIREGNRCNNNKRPAISNQIEGWNNPPPPPTPKSLTEDEIKLEDFRFEHTNAGYPVLYFKNVQQNLQFKKIKSKNSIGYQFKQLDGRGTVKLVITDPAFFRIE